MMYSFRLFHGSHHQWLVRCDPASELELKTIPQLVTDVFQYAGGQVKLHTRSAAFKTFVSEKPRAIANAWKEFNPEAVLILDADVVFTGEIFSSVRHLESDLLLSPNYHPPGSEHLAFSDGYYNAGFVMTRRRDFHDWWAKAIQAQPWRFSDQACLNDAWNIFSIAALDANANVGMWRSIGPEFTGLFSPIPRDCRFFHAHLFQPIVSDHWQWLDKSFALHCLKFLYDSGNARHRELYDEVLRRDASRWYEVTLQMIGCK